MTRSPGRCLTLWFGFCQEKSREKKEKNPDLDIDFARERILWISRVFQIQAPPHFIPSSQQQIGHTHFCHWWKEKESSSKLTQQDYTYESTLCRLLYSIFTKLHSLLLFSVNSFLNFRYSISIFQLWYF